MKFLMQRVHRSAVAWSFFATLLRVGANVFVLPVVLRKLPADQFGIWAVFATIGSLAALLDLGFESVIARMTSYAWAGAARFVAFGIHQDEAEPLHQKPNLPLLRDLIATLKAYYFYAGLGVLVFLTAGGGGWIWFKTQNWESANSIRLAWLVYAGGCCLNFVIGRWPALLNGVGAVREAQMATILSLLFYYVFVTAGMLAGLGLWALVLGYVGMGFVARSQGQWFFKKMVALPGGLPRAHFHREIFHAIWPSAWRTGLVGISSFLSLQAATLICFGVLTSAVTASYFLSFQLVNMLFGLCSVWLAVKLPFINTLRQQRREAEIAELFARRMRLTLLCYIAGALVIIFFAPPVLHWMKSKTLPICPEQLAMLALIRLLELHHTAYTMLVLSENYNPFLKSSVISGVAVVVISLVLTPLFGVWGVILSTGIVGVCFNNWWPVLRALRGLNLKPGEFFIHHYLRPKAWLELF
jgi:O-antigen/teichoic acid export membrane protein